MDKIVDHLFVFDGKGIVYDFPGNYSDYKASGKNQNSPNSKKEVQPEPVPGEIKDVSKVAPNKRKPSFKEKREFETISKEIEALETEKSELETQLNSGSLNTDELIVKSNRISEIITVLDKKSERWFELSEDV
jgi:ATP-binding cassette subfamily F protein uup